jgi:negative regulator of sigma E activity
MFIHDALMTGETQREEAIRELARNEERVEVDAKQHPN